MIFVSASREKIRRREERAEGKEKRQVRAQKIHKDRKKTKLLKTIAGAVAIVLVVLIILFNSSLLYSSLTAIRMGDWKFKNTDFNYEYYSSYYNTYSQIYSTYGDYSSMLLDTKKPLDEQQYSEGQTWDDYFEETALNNLQQMAILYDMGKKAGFELTDEQKDVIQTTITSMKRDATDNKYTDFDKYLKSLYKKGMSEKLLTKLLNTSYYATYYSQSLIQQWKDSYTDEQKTEYYNGKRSQYDLLTYYTYYVDGSADEEAGIDAETAMANANNTAQAIAAAATEESFADLVYQNAPEDQKETYSDPDACRREDVAPSSISNTDWLNWLTDAERSYGNTKVFPSDTGYYVFMYVSTNPNEYKLENYRSIVVQVQANEETGEVTNENIEAAKATVEEIMSKYNEDPTEDNFTALTEEYNAKITADSGLHQNVNMSQLSGDVKDYIFSPDRKTGEVNYIYTDKTFYIFYMLDEGDQYNLSLAEGLMTQDDYKKLIDGASDEYAINTTFVFKFAK
jgi:hypothetical protein